MPHRTSRRVSGVKRASEHETRRHAFEKPICGFLCSGHLHLTVVVNTVPHNLLLHSESEIYEILNESQLHHPCNSTQTTQMLQISTDKEFL